MSEFIQGRIVYCSELIPDPQGRNPKRNRPFVVISPNEYVAIADDVEAVAITKNFWDSGPDVVAVPHSPPGKYCMTGLNEQSVVRCDWKVALNQESLTTKKGYVPPTVLEVIIRQAANHPVCYTMPGPST